MAPTEVTYHIATKPGRTRAATCWALRYIDTGLAPRLDLTDSTPWTRHDRETDCRVAKNPEAARA